MFKINADLSIEITRGDAVDFIVTAKENEENYVFKIGDVVRFKVFEKKGCDCVVLQKDFGVESDTEEVTIVLDEADTKIGQLINKPKDYWYEVELNPDTLPTTIIGYDEDGAKIFKLYPEGRDLGSDPITPDDIPFVDKELDITSHNPVENQAIAKQFAVVDESVNQNAANIQAHTAEINNIKNVNTTQANSINNNATAIKNHANNKENPHGVTAAQVGAVPTSRTVNGKPLTGNITLSASDVGARPNTWMPTAEQVGAAPKSHATNKNNPHDVTAAQVGAMPTTGGTMTGMAQFKPENGTSVITVETYRNLPSSNPTASYKTRNVIASNGAAMQFFKGSVGTDPSTEVNRLTLTETDTQLMKPLTISSGGTGRDLSAAPAGAVFRNASDGTGMYYTPTASGAMFATAENGTPKFGTLPVAQGGTGATKPADAITNLGINDYVVAQGKSEGWTYRKWNSGVAECWTLAKETTPTANGINSCTVPLPFEFYNQNYYANVSCYKTAAQNYAHDFLVSSSSNGDGRTATSLTFKYNYSSDTFYSVGFNVHVIGRWK